MQLGLFILSSFPNGGRLEPINRMMLYTKYDFEIIRYLKIRLIYYQKIF